MNLRAITHASYDLQEGLMPFWSAWAMNARDEAQFAGGNKLLTASIAKGRWPYRVGYCLRGDILQAIEDDKWQTLRRSLKGKPTQHKLELLEAWLLDGPINDEERRIQVDNYINSLKRGGQLDLDLNIIR